MSCTYKAKRKLCVRVVGSGYTSHAHMPASAGSWLATGGGCEPPECPDRPGGCSPRCPRTRGSVYKTAGLQVPSPLPYGYGVGGYVVRPSSASASVIERPRHRSFSRRVALTVDTPFGSADKTYVISCSSRTQMNAAASTFIPSPLATFKTWLPSTPCSPPPLSPLIPSAPRSRVTRCANNGLTALRPSHHGVQSSHSPERQCCTRPRRRGGRPAVHDPDVRP